jgi:hypothetical protein
MRFQTYAQDLAANVSPASMAGGHCTARNRTERGGAGDGCPSARERECGNSQPGSESVVIVSLEMVALIGV